MDRYGRYVLLTHHDLDRAEGWYDRHGAWGVFVGRLIPVIRNFVALPAGVAEYPLVPFGILTFLGSLIWLTHHGAHRVRRRLQLPPGHEGLQLRRLPPGGGGRRRHRCS